MAWTEITGGAVRARIAARGAALVGLWHDAWPHSVVLGTDDPHDLLNAHPYAGTIVGPVANRVGGAAVTINGARYAMHANEGYTCLHSGHEGLHAQDWTLEASGARAELRCTLPDGACGLPGDRHVAAIYQLSGETLTVTLTAASDQDTLMNLALHPYFSLDASWHLEDHQLAVGGATYLPTHNNLPVGHQAQVAELGLWPDPAPLSVPLDHAVCLSHAPAAILQASTGPRLTVRTDAPALQVYDGAHLPRVAGSHGAPIGPGAGLALEPQMWPDAPNHPGFPSVVLRAGVLWQQVTTYCLAFDRSGTEMP